jgi:hypothetical protein
VPDPLPRISLDALQLRGVYEIAARNFNLAVWDGRHFWGVRYKYDDVGYLAPEDHYDHGDGTSGSCRPLAFLHLLPADIQLRFDEDRLRDYLINLKKTLSK